MRNGSNEAVIFKGWVCVLGGGCYTGTSEAFARGTLPGISRTIKAQIHDASVVVKITAEKANLIRKYYNEEIQNCFVEQGQKGEDSQLEL